MCHRVVIHSWIALLMLLPLAAGAATTAPATQSSLELPPSTQPMTREQKVTRLLDYLENLYISRINSPDPVRRALGVISLSKSPGATATSKLLDLAQHDA